MIRKEELFTYVSHIYGRDNVLRRENKDSQVIPK